MISSAISMQRSRGFSLIEVMVSVGVLSVALLGTAGLMAASLRNTNTAYHRSQATILADDMLDRMRTNLVAARGGAYNIDLYLPNEAPELSGKSGVALYDCTDWTTSVADALPGGVGTATVDFATGVATIEIRWEGDGASLFTTVSHLGTP